MKPSTGNLIEDLKSILKPFYILLVQPWVESYYGYRENYIPFFRLCVLGSLISAIHYFGGANWLLYFVHLKLNVHPDGDSYIGMALSVSGFYFWGLWQIRIRRKLQKKLNEVFANADLKTRLGELPNFVFDRPNGATSRKLRVAAAGIPLSQFKSKIENLDSGLNINVFKIENPNDNKELIDINYTLEKMPEFWLLDILYKYKDFSFPIGKSINGEVKTNLRKVPHYLIAGETNSGKSTFIRSAVMVLNLNNADSISTVYVDLKGKMDGQVFDEFKTVKVLGEINCVLEEFNALNLKMDRRMDEAQKLKVKNIDEYNSKQKKKSDKWERILIVVDEIAELMPSLGMNDRQEKAKVQTLLNRFSRLGRAVGYHLMIGVQKPDHKNLDPTIKANLPGILCFPVSHFSQSTLILGNGHAADLNAKIQGRGIWKYGSEEIEVQAPFLSLQEMNQAQTGSDEYFNKTNNQSKEVKVEEKENEATQTAYTPSG